MAREELILAQRRLDEYRSRIAELEEANLSLSQKAEALAVNLDEEEGNKIALISVQEEEVMRLQNGSRQQRDEFQVVLSNISLIILSNLGCVEAEACSRCGDCSLQKTYRQTREKAEVRFPHFIFLNFCCRNLETSAFGNEDNMEEEEKAENKSRKSSSSSSSSSSDEEQDSGIFDKMKAKVDEALD